MFLRAQQAAQRQHQKYTTKIHFDPFFPYTSYLVSRDATQSQQLLNLKDVLMQVEIYALPHEPDAFHP